MFFQDPAIICMLLACLQEVHLPLLKTASIQLKLYSLPWSFLIRLMTKEGPFRQYGFRSLFGALIFQTCRVCIRANRLRGQKVLSLL